VIKVIPWNLYQDGRSQRAALYNARPHAILRFFSLRGFKSRSFLGILLLLVLFLIGYLQKKESFQRIAQFSRYPIAPFMAMELKAHPSS
jgi:hypothetical protein